MDDIRLSVVQVLARERTPARSSFEHGGYLICLVDVRSEQAARSAAYFSSCAEETWCKRLRKHIARHCRMRALLICVNSLGYITTGQNDIAAIHHVYEYFVSPSVAMSVGLQV